jgi:hypothetical protein
VEGRTINDDEVGPSRNARTFSGAAVRPEMLSSTASEIVEGFEEEAKIYKSSGWGW